MFEAQLEKIPPPYDPQLVASTATAIGLALMAV